MIFLSRMVLGNDFKIQYCGAIWSLPKRERSANSPKAVTCSRSVQHTACSLRWESGMYENYGWAQPEGTLDSESGIKSISQYGLQDPQNQNARSSWEPSSDSNSYGETCNSTVNHRIAGVPGSAVEPQNTIRENNVNRLIEKFDNHMNKYLLVQDLKQTEKINKFSKESQGSIADMNNTEIFELCENSYKQQCLDCNAYREMGIIYCSCGRSLTSTRSPTECDQNNRDVTSIHGCVINKNRKRGVQHGASERQKMYFQAKQMLKNERQAKHGSHSTIHSRWYADADCRKSLSDIGWREHHIMLYDRVALEKHIYKATRAERIQIANNWILRANSEGGTQLPLNRRPDFAQAKRACKRLHDEHLERTQWEYRDIPRSQQIRQRKGQQLEGHEDFDYVVDPNTGWGFYRLSWGNLQTFASGSRANLFSSNSRTLWWINNCARIDGARVVFPYDWKEFVFQKILENGLIAGGKQSKEGRQTIFLTPLNSFGEDAEEKSTQWWLHNSQGSALWTVHHKYSTYRVAHSIITFHHANASGSRWHIIFVSPKNICHPRVMSHLPLFDSSPFLPPTSQTPTTLLEYDEHLGPYERSHCDDLR